MAKEKLLCIEWDDASSYSSWQDREASANEDCKPYRCRTVGFLVTENDKSVLLAQGVSANNKVNNVFQIPKTQIRKRKTIATMDALPRVK